MASHRTPPPLWLETIVSALLPASRREQVLGDLKERCVPERSYANIRYVIDALTALPHVCWSVIRRSLDFSRFKVAGASNQEILERTQQLRAPGLYGGVFAAWIMLFWSIARAYPGFPWGSLGMKATLCAGLAYVVWRVPITPRFKTRGPKPLISGTLFTVRDTSRKAIMADYRAALGEQRSSGTNPLALLYAAVVFALLASQFFPLFWPGQYAPVGRAVPAEIAHQRVPILINLFLAGLALCFLRGRLRARTIQREIDALEPTA